MKKTPNFLCPGCFEVSLEPIIKDSVTNTKNDNERVSLTNSDF